VLSLDGSELCAPAPYRSGWIVAEPARSPQLVRAYYALRRQVFVEEQGLFAEHDRDGHDERALKLVASATSAGVPDDVVGVVRIYEAEPSVWWGGRLAVAHPYRRVAEVGGSLIRAAVGSARGFGASRFFATVQQHNRAYFERHAFRFLEERLVCGAPHVLMEADLAAFAVPPWARVREAA
jgi:putative N-acetyltransferase (TIGR04045 family)